MVNNFNEKYNLKINFKYNVKIDTINKDISLVVYRVVQEAITNTLKHSMTDYCLINLFFDTNFITGIIEDNGTGFDPESIAQNKKKTSGIRIMKERVNSLNGQLTVISSKDNGTKIEFVIPLNEDDDAKD